MKATRTPVSHRLAAALVALLTLLSPIAAAETVLEDPEGDVQAQAGGVPTTPPLGSATVDLLALDVTEDVSTIRFTLSLLSTEAGDQAGESHRITLRHNDQEYALAFVRDAGMTDYYGYLAARQAGATFMVIMTELEVVQDDSAGTLAAEVERHMLVDRNGAAPMIGRVLEDVEVMSFGTSILLFSADADDPGVQVRDVMTGPEGPIAIPMAYGVEQSGEARLISAQPFRTSNGAATTFVYHVEASNLASQEHVFSFDILELPASWDVTIPFDTVAIGPGETMKIPVLVQSPFAHTHGARQTFIVEMHSQSDPGSVGRVELGVQYPEVPQPAGHHDKLWFHTRDEGLRLERTDAVGAATGEGRDSVVTYLNTLETDERDDHVPARGDDADRDFFSDDVPALASGSVWTLLLEPELRMGLRLDGDRVGHLEVPLRVETPNLGAWVEGHLVWLGPNTDPGGFNEVRKELILATFASGQFDLEAGVTTLVTAPINTTDIVERPYVPGAQLALRIGLALDRPDNPFGAQADQPQLLPGGWAQLPLLEYEDALDDVLVDESLTYTVAQATRIVNPGGTALFRIHIDQGPADITLLGSNKAWATLLTAGPAQDIEIAVTAPMDALDDDRADLVLQLTNGEGRAFVRLVTIVDTDSLHDDDASLIATADKKSPIGGIVFIGVGIAAVISRRLT